MDLSKQFSFTDLLAYLFPGIISTFGIYLILILTPASIPLSKVSLDITTGILFVVISYVIGVVFSGFSSLVVQIIERLQRYQDVRKTIAFDELQDDILKAFNDVFDQKVESKSKWSRTYYFLCRALVLEKMPTIGLRSDRQNNLALFRRNLILPLLVWLTTGVAWGISITLNKSYGWGMLLIVCTIVVSFLAVKTTIDRLHEGEKRETREILLGFLAGYQAKLLINQSKN